MQHPILALAVAAAVASTPHLARTQEVNACDWVANPANILEPWSEFSRSFANGAIRIAVLDTGGEPVCCATHLLVVAPSASDDPPIFRQCFQVSDTGGMGFYDIDFPGITASYDASLGLRIEVPVSRFHDGVGQGKSGMPGQVVLRINQATGTVVLE